MAETHVLPANAEQYAAFAYPDRREATKASLIIGWLVIIDDDGTRRAEPLVSGTKHPEPEGSVVITVIDNDAFTTTAAARIALREYIEGQK